MKKTSINVLCILIILLITGSVISPVIYMTKYFYAGVRSGIEQRETEVKGGTPDNTIPDPTEYNLADIYFEPDLLTLVNSNDSISFSDGPTYRMILTRATAFLPKSQSAYDTSWIVNILYVGTLLLYILLLVQFVKFIININKGNIFDGKNVVRLRRFAWYLISISILKCIAGLIEDITFKAFNLSLDGYSLSAYWEMPWSTMVLGFLALLMAQIWSYGLQIEKDRELTI